MGRKRKKIGNDVHTLTSRRSSLPPVGISKLHRAQKGQQFVGCQSVDSQTLWRSLCQVLQLNIIIIFFFFCDLLTKIANSTNRKVFLAIHFAPFATASDT